MLVDHLGHEVLIPAGDRLAVLRQWDKQRHKPFGLEASKTGWVQLLTRCGRRGHELIAINEADNYDCPDCAQ